MRATRAWLALSSRAARFQLLHPYPSLPSPPILRATNVPQRLQLSFNSPGKPCILSFALRLPLRSMSTGCDSTAQGSNAVPRSASFLSNGSLRIKLPEPELPPALRSSVTVVGGRCPYDLPYWFNQMDSWDRRYMPPYTMRFSASASTSDVDLEGAQDEIRRAVWQATEIQMIERNLPGPLPSVLVELDPLDPLKVDGCIDVTFANEDGLVAMVSCLSEIQIEKASGAICTLPFVYCSNSLPSNVIPFDLLRVPLTEDNSKAVFKSLDAMVSDVGAVIGLAWIDYDQTSLRKLRPNDVLRAYLKLAPTSMALPFEVLATKMPTHFKWEGVPYTLQYAGRDFHKTPLHSAHFPLHGEAEGGSNSSTRLSSPSRSSPISGEQFSILDEV